MITLLIILAVIFVLLPLAMMLLAGLMELLASPAFWGTCLAWGAAALLASMHHG